MYISVLYLS